jgi:hypothetical protein
MSSTVTPRWERPSPGDRSDATLSTVELATIGGLASMIAIHATELSGKVDEVAYLGFGYLALIVASAISIAMIATRDRRGWVLAGTTAATTLVGYVLTRTTGLPGSHDDVGNWGETLAVWAMVSEIAVCALTALVLRPGAPPRS